jgi:hypothetical protein
MYVFHVWVNQNFIMDYVDAKMDNIWLKMAA